MSNASTAIKKVIIAEGGATYTNRKNDSGGPTKYGITLKTLSDWRKKQCTADDVKNLGEAEAIAIYKANYWDKIKGDQLPYNVAYALFNQGVVRGPGAAVMTAQKILGVIQDGGMGSITISKILSMGEKSFLERFLSASIQEAKDLVARRPKDQENLNGWLNRIQHISDYVGVSPAAAATGAGAVLVAGLFFLILITSSKSRLA